MGLFPAAITLADNGFDVVELPGMPDYFEGGPNTHSTSPVTFATSVVLRAPGLLVTAFSGRSVFRRAVWLFRP
jgi:hypothetical protein